MKLAWAFLIGVPLALQNASSWSMAFSLFYQSFVLMLSTKFLISSTRFLSTGLDTDVVRLLKVF